MVYSVLLSVLHFETILLVDSDRHHQSAVGVWKATQQAKWSTASERAIKIELKNGVRKVYSILFDFCLCMTSSGGFVAAGAP